MSASYVGVLCRRLFDFYVGRFLVSVSGSLMYFFSEKISGFSGHVIRGISGESFGEHCVQYFFLAKKPRG